MLNNLRAKMLSLQFRAIRRAVIVLIAKIPKDLERAITFGDALNHFLMISPFINDLFYGRVCILSH